MGEAILTAGPDARAEYSIAWSARGNPAQMALLKCPIFEVFFGGARGGGKTDGMLGEWVQHADRYGKDAIGLMLRRTRTELIETIERSRAIYSPLGWTYNETEKMWRATNGARLRFAYLERDADAELYQGHSYTRLYVEEIGTFPSPAPILKLMATLRSSAGVPVGFRATGNPGGPGHQWVKARYIDPAPLGNRIIRDEQTNLKRVFIPSKVDNNRHIDVEAYKQRLRASGSKELVSAWLDGDWSVTLGAFFDCWDSGRHVIRPFEVPKEWMRFRSMDWGSAFIPQSTSAGRRFHAHPRRRRRNAEHCKCLSHPHPALPDRPRGREADRGGAQAWPLRASGRDHDPAGLPPRASSFRALRSAMAPGRAEHRPSARPQEQKGHPLGASNAGRRNSRPAAPAA
jgi:hypothetical protein